MTFEWGHSVVVYTFQMATLLILSLAISEEIAYTQRKMEAEDKNGGTLVLQKAELQDGYEQVFETKTWLTVIPEVGSTKSFVV